MKEVAKFPGLTKRGARYVLRTFVPKDIVQSYGKREIVTALGTADASEAVKRAKMKAAEFVRHFDEHRRTLVAASQKVKEGASGTGGTPVATDLPRLSATLSQANYVAVKERDVVERAELYQLVAANDVPFFKGEVRPLPNTDYWYQLIVGDPDVPLTSVLSFCWWHWHGERIADLKQDIKGGNLANHVATVETMLGPQKAPKAQRLILAKAIMQAEIEALTDIRKGDDERYHALVTPKVELPATASIPDNESPPLSEVAPKWMAEKTKAGKWRPRRADSCRRTIDLFVEIVGDKRIGDYSKADVRDFKAILCDLPPNRTKLPETRDLDVRAAAKKARQLDLPRMSIVNVNKLLTIISGMFDWFIGQYDGVSVNPFAKATIEVSSNIREERDPFTLDELKTIFAAPIFVGCHSEDHWKEPGTAVLQDTAKFWLPLLGLYTGARLNELCKLRVVDVRQVDGIHFIDINTEGHRSGGIDPRVKSTASVRQIPLHADLIAFGFLDFVAGRRGERLFAELRVDKYGQLADGFGKHFRRFLVSLDIKREKIDFHSFRHTWTDACLNSRIPDSVTLALKGESRPGTLARYGHGKTNLEILSEETAKLAYKGLDLSHLRVTTGAGVSP